MAAAPCAGFLSMLDVQSELSDPAVIGTKGFAERLRFVAWRDQPIWRW